MICFLDMDAFVKKEQGQRTEIYRAAGETWLNDLCSFMDREMTFQQNWWTVFGEVLNEAVKFWSQFKK